MSAVIGVLVAVLVLAAVIRWFSGRRRRKPPRVPAVIEPAPPDEPPAFRILTLGGAGTGKTVFLASMFHELDHRSPRRRYYLKTTSDDRILLAEIYSTVSDTGKPFPPGTHRGDKREFVFNCVGVDDSNGAKAPVLRVSYLDYAGEVLERRQEGGSTALDELVVEMERADSLLGIIDGYRVWQLLSGMPAGETHFRDTLQPLFGFMVDAACPIQFVITKWDLVRDFGEPADADDQCRLDLVIAALMKFDHFKSLVHEHSRHQVVRLIPVSAVGQGFARIVDGKVSKREGASVRPYNVDAPFSAVLPDLFKQVAATLDTATLKNLREEGRRALVSNRLDALAVALAGPATKAAQTLLRAAYGVAFSQRLTTAYLQWMSAPLDVTAEKLAEKADDAERELAQRQHLRALVMEDFDRTIRRLEALLPQSELRSTW